MSCGGEAVTCESFVVASLSPEDHGDRAVLRQRKPCVRFQGAGGAALEWHTLLWARAWLV